MLMNHATSSVAPPSRWKRPGRRTTLPLCSALLSATAAIASPASQGSPPATVASADLSRYAGTWYEIARFPNRFQKQCTGDVTATYAIRTDGVIDVVNRCRVADGSIEEATGEARRVEGHANALADDYSTAVVGSPDRKYLWLLSRTPSLPESTYQEMVAAARSQGFDSERLAKTAQR